MNGISTESKQKTMIFFLKKSTLKVRTYNIKI